MKECIVCGKEYAGRNKHCCSRACWSIARLNFRACVICGKLFQTPPSAGIVTCSPECSTAHRQQMHKAGRYDGMQAALAAHVDDPRFHPGIENMNAKVWVIRSPGGQTHECRNLMHWLREHADMLDGTPGQAWDGIVKIKYSMQGKRRNPSRSWKGWTLIDWGD